MRNSPYLREQILRCKQLWNNWEQLRCVAHSPLIVSMKIALLVSFGTSIVQIQSVRVKFDCTKDFSISRQKRLSMPAIHVCVPGAKYPFCGTNNFLFLSFGQGIHNFDESPKSIEDVIGDVSGPGKFSFNRAKCESLENYVTTPRSIHCFGKCGTCFLLTQFFYVTRSRKDDKSRNNTLLLC